MSSWFTGQFTEDKLTAATYAEQLAAWATIREFCPDDATEMARMIGLVE
jgi:NADH pyrophosphatase NudC (nudix superfamily)